MSMNTPQSPPAWQTEELQDEWVELEPDDNVENDNATSSTRSISFTTPLPTRILTSIDADSNRSTASSCVAGTFFIREDVPNVPFLPKTPGRNKNVIKDFFTPLPLETMFEPPTPPEPESSTLSSKPQSAESRGTMDDMVETHKPKLKVSSNQTRKSNMACKFTFSIPRDNFTDQNEVPRGPCPQAQSTPIPPITPHHAPPPPTMDSRLRLFQFQYDTYTRDHLSAMVDSIAVNTPSGSATGTTPSPTTCNPTLSRVSEVTGSEISHLRSAKRVKLSPRTDFYGEGAGAGALISRPKLTGQDYVDESRTFMQKIKQAPDFSTISSVASARQSSTNSSDNDDEDMPYSTTNPPSSASSVKSQFNSSSQYRQQAADLMAQIRNDMKGQQCLSTSDTSSSRISHPEDGGTSNGQQASLTYPNSSRALNLQVSRSYSTSELKHLINGVSRMAVEDKDKASRMNLSPPVQSSHNSQLQRHHQNSHQNVVPLYPSSSLRNGNADDLNRFVSSSTTSGTTLTVGSAPSFVKHAGPAHIRTISPGDVPELPDRLGDMILDKATMKWVKINERKQGGDTEIGSVTEISEDPFGDIESLRDETINGLDQTHETSQMTEDDCSEAMSPIEEQSEMDDEEMELTSFSTDASLRVVPVMTGVENDELEGEQDRTTDSEHERDGPTIEDKDAEGTGLSIVEEAIEMPDNLQAVQSPPGQQALEIPIKLATARSASATTPVIRSAMKSSSVTPASALKNANNRLHTPQQKDHRRSVSFSDGKQDGPIRGLSTSRVDSAGTSTPMSFVQSLRSKRITEMINALEDSDTDLDENELPSKADSPDRPEEIRPFTDYMPDQPASMNRESSRSRVFSKSYTLHPSSRTQSADKLNGTFLTECSFGVAHDRLVQVITDVQPFEPFWDELNAVDLSNKKLESVARLKEFMPQLDVLNLNSNELSWLTGVPESVRTLSVAFNCLTGLTSYSHLTNLENLDISRNEVESLRQLACLRHLHELKADGNKIASLEGLERMDGLVKLSIQGNCIQSINLRQFKWTRLEMLNMSRNHLEAIQGLASLQSLIALNLDNNQLEELKADGYISKLRILRISGNRLQELNAASFPNLRTLYADNNSLMHLAKLDRLTRLENLSLRNQRGRGLNLLTRDVRDVKRLYLSGNAIKSGFLEEHCYNLVYLELAACRLTALPEEMARLVPNLRVLNLNYNFLEDVRPLEGLTRLKKLSIIGSRLKGTKALIRLLQRMPDVEMLDFRMNPCTLGWYLPLLVKDVPGALQPSEGGRVGGRGWQELDSKFRRDLPDETYIGRLAYRGLVMGACPRIRILDGVEISEKERRKAEVLLEGILGRRGEMR
ncbi:hypothetical protein AMATHDRAFT_78647 [Amanita thiersii Skay4041]|uniref:Septation initiation network scaffold protein cdc11 n=1 Tax=Amanita thiersii Skay4041 TaxID=703135 RepID=A0A2A9P059_9AGAR|nr:hypothetical protein AMATHDRAFT_78647 [Amanita thiersii Skay4041]